MNEAAGPAQDTTSQPLADRLIRAVDNTELPERREKKLGTEQIIGVVVGRDRTVVPPHEVYKLAAIGCKDIEIAEWFGIASDTLRRNFAVELTKGRENMRQSLRRKMLETAMSGHAVMLIFMAKNFLGMSDNPGSAQDLAPLPWSDDQTEVETA